MAKDAGEQVEMLIKVDPLKLQRILEDIHMHRWIEDVWQHDLSKPDADMSLGDIAKYAFYFADLLAAAAPKIGWLLTARLLDTLSIETVLEYERRYGHLVNADRKRG